MRLRPKAAHSILESTEISVGFQLNWVDFKRVSIKLTFLIDSLILSIQFDDIHVHDEHSNLRRLHIFQTDTETVSVFSY